MLERGKEASEKWKKPGKTYLPPPPPDEETGEVDPPFVPGTESLELKAQSERISSIMAAIYINASQIPESPAEPEPGTSAAVETKVISLYGSHSSVPPPPPPPLPEKTEQERRFKRMREGEQRTQRKKDGKKRGKEAKKVRAEQVRQNNRKTRKEEWKRKRHLKGESERGGRTLQQTRTTRASFTEGQVVWYLPPRHVLNNFVARGVSPTGWDQMQNENLQMEPGRFMATVIRLGSYSDCTIRVHGGQYYNRYENEKEVLTNVPLNLLSPI
jgi:hypothetical protein